MTKNDYTRRVKSLYDNKKISAEVRDAMLFNIGAFIDKGCKYYELQTTSNYHIYYNNFLTETELYSDKWQAEIANLKSGEYGLRIVHLKEITKAEYEKATEISISQTAY